MEGLKIRMYKDGDEKVINDLFNEIFGKHRTLDEWQWKFKEIPLNDINLITVAELDGKIVGQYSNIPLLFKYRNKTVNFASPVDNFVHPDFRGGVKGIQSLMFQHQDETARNNRILLGFGFPNREAYIIGKRMLKYKDMGDVSVLCIRLNLRLGLKSRFPWLPDIALEAARYISNIGYNGKLIFKKFQERYSREFKIQELQSFDDRFNSLWEKARDQHEIIGQRDKRYLNWRYKKPGFAYRSFAVERGEELAGYIVTNISKDADGSVVGYIVDLLTDDTKGADLALIEAALRRFVLEKVDFALCWMLKDKSYYTSLQRFGFIEKETFPPVKTVYFMFDNETIEDVFVKDIRHWYFTMGDSDVY